ncbi:endonuclease/exonuclease/phosphatase family protein [Leeuwenhoekiella sp. NPDC079379]|uniref:endonuclease/exonuclease/phosphatase family protein n=1 Tax=Leeuwenhoekiella sp. NPDC079379 TaxID=3364122 RepID=UPI0037CC09AC
MRFKNILHIFGAIAILLTLVPLIAADYWWIRVFDFPHTQLTILTATAILAYLLKFDIKWVKDYVFMSVMIACFVYQISKIYPYTPLAQFEVNTSEQNNPNKQLSILVANVLQKNEDKQSLLKEVAAKNPDILLLLEANTEWQRFVDPTLSKKYKFYKGAPINNTYGMLLYSKIPLINPEIHYLIDDSIPSIDSKVKLASGDTIQLFAIHPTPPMPQHNPMSTDRDAEMMKTAFQSRDSKLPVLVIGDFNDVAWSESTALFKNVSELLDLRIGRGLFNTFSAKSQIMRWPLDHIFVSEHFRVIDVQTGADINSDHFPSYAKLNLESEIAQEQRADPPSENQLKRALDIIKKEAGQKDTRKEN